MFCLRLSFRSIIPAILAAGALNTGHAQSPGNVSSNLQLWLKADAGVTGNPVTTWADQSGLSNDATATTGPTVLSSQLNGNPTLDFTSASSEFLEITGGILGTGTYNDMWFYYVSQTDNSGITNTIFNENLAGASEYFMSLNTWSNAQAYIQLGVSPTGRLNGAWGGTDGEYYMWTMGTSTGTSTPNGTRKAISRDGAVILSNDNNDNGVGNNQRFYIGGRYTGANNYYLDGEIAELHHIQLHTH